MPLNNPPFSPLQTSSGSYAGNDTANRAIPHGLPATPKVILIGIALNSEPRKFIIKGVLGGIIDESLSQINPVTIPNATDFYVGNAVNYTASANAVGINYTWVAIG